MTSSIKDEILEDPESNDAGIRITAGLYNDSPRSSKLSLDGSEKSQTPAAHAGATEERMGVPSLDEIRRHRIRTRGLSSFFTAQSP